MKKKLLLFTVSLVFIVAGGLFQMAGFQEFSGLGFLGVALSVLLITHEQRVSSERSRSIIRQSTELRKEVQGVRALTTWYGKQLLDYGNSSYKRLKVLYDSENANNRHATTTPKLASSKAPSQSSAGGSVLRTGRASTPEVTNANTEETLEAILRLTREKIIVGVFSEKLTRGFKSQVHFLHPSTVMDLLISKRPDLVILDERYLNSGHWQGSFTASGTSQLAEILEGVEWCNNKGIPVFLLTDEATPEVHSFALRKENLVILPLREEDEEQAFGAELTPIVNRAHHYAIERRNKE